MNDSKNLTGNTFNNYNATIILDFLTTDVQIQRVHKIRLYKEKTLNSNNKTNNNNPESGGQRGWDLGFPALHRHHSGTGRKDTQNGKRCGN